MCHFVTAVLPREAPVSELDAIARRHHRRLQPQANPSIEAELRPGERYFLTTSGHCDCGTPLGALARGRMKKPLDCEGEAKRLRALGWGETKISRWLAQKAQAAERNAFVRHAEGTLAMDEWLQFLTDVLGSKLTPYIGILLHWYDGPLTGRLQLQGREVVGLSDVTVDTLARLKEDVIYEFRSLGP